MTITGDDPKKFAAAMVEYSKEKVGGVGCQTLGTNLNLFAFIGVYINKQKKKKKKISSFKSIENI